ncbi:hypothetical protein LPJ74_001604 [Coemansia sp. RSA 1843]|nr:hypothetical protein LPJ74_001604 [Coemansia sp. RSA 1843]
MYNQIRRNSSTNEGAVNHSSMQALNPGVGIGVSNANRRASMPVHGGAGNLNPPLVATDSHMASLPNLDCSQVPNFDKLFFNQDLPQPDAASPETWLRNAGFISNIADFFTPPSSSSSSSSSPSSSPLAVPAIPAAKDDGASLETAFTSDGADHEADQGTPAKRTRYQCELCLKCFTRPSSLATHMHTHTGEKPHQCVFPGCEKRFSVLSNLRRHSKLHEDPMPRNHRKGHLKRFFNMGYHPYAQHMVHFPALPPHILPPAHHHIGFGAVPMFPCQIAAGDHSLFNVHGMTQLPPLLFPPSHIVGPFPSPMPQPPPSAATSQVTQQQQSQLSLFLSQPPFDMPFPVAGNAIQRG